MSQPGWNSQHSDADEIWSQSSLSNWDHTFCCCSPLTLGTGSGVGLLDVSAWGRPPSAPLSASPSGGSSPWVSILSSMPGTKVGERGSAGWRGVERTQPFMVALRRILALIVLRWRLILNVLRLRASWRCNRCILGCISDGDPGFSLKPSRGDPVGGEGSETDHTARSQSKNPGQDAQCWEFPWIAIIRIQGAQL